MKKRITALLLAVVMTMSLCLIASADGGNLFRADFRVTYGQTEARSMLKMINDFRTGSDANYKAPDGSIVTCEGLEKLSYSYALEEIAMQRAAEVALSHSHTRPDGTSCFDCVASNGARSFGENICAGYGLLNSAEDAFDTWREDNYDYSGQGHRRNMLASDFKAVGIGFVKVDGRCYWAQAFSYYTDSMPATAACDVQRQVTVYITESRLSNLENTAVNPGSLSLFAGQTRDVPTVSGSPTVMGCFYPPTVSAVTTPAWTSSNESVVRVDGSKLTALKAGTATLTATVFGQTYTCKVTVKGSPYIKTQPKSVSQAVGTTAKFSVVAEGPGLTYQWQIKTPSSTKWVNSTASSGKTATLSAAVTAGKNGYQYRCVVTDANGAKATSSAAKLTVKTTVTAQPSNKSAKVGATVKFTVAATGPCLKYQWQIKTPGSANWVNSTASSGKTASLSVAVTAGRNGYQYRCVITDANGVKTTSGVAKLTVGTTITAQPASVSAKAGTTVKFTVGATGPGLKYQWQIKTSAGAAWVNSTASSGKTASLAVAVTAGRNGYQYRCVITDANGGKVYTKAVTLTVK